MRRFPGRNLALLLFTASFLAAAPAVGQSNVPPGTTLRDLSGTVTDTGHEPLRGAVVKLQNSKTNAIESYITDASGHYNFKHLDSSIDFQVWATFRGRRSRQRSISMFNSHPGEVVNLAVKTY
jgi:hypothetical protein